MGVKLEQFSDWNGTFGGSYDGRSALLKVEATSNPANNFDGHLKFVFLDIERNFSRTSTAIINLAPGAEYWYTTDTTFGDWDTTWPFTTIHTHDIDWISGYTTWNSQQYGFWLRRLATSQTVSLQNGKPFTDMSDFIGKWTGVADGIPSTMAIVEDKSNKDPRVIVLEFVIDIETNPHSSYRGKHTWDRSANRHTTLALQFPEVGGVPIEADTFHDLQLHTWNINYMSGVFQQGTQLYGMAYQRQV